MKISNEQRQNILSCFLFSDCKVETLDAFLNELKITKFSKNQTIYSPHHYKKALAIILNGEVIVKNAAGVPLNTLKPCDCFGAAGLFQKTEEYVSTLVGNTSGELVLIPAEDLTSLFQNNPQIAINYIFFLSGRIEFLSRKIQSFTAPSAEIRLAIEILDRSCDDIVLIPNGYAELARHLNIGRASLYRAFDLLEAKGMIQKCEKQIIIRDRNSLEGLISESMV